MRIKIDENLPFSVVQVLEQLGHDTDHVVTEGLSGRDDPTVWAAAQSEERFLVTQDLRFASIHGTGDAHAGVLLIRVHNASADELSRIVRMIFLEHEVEQWRGRLGVATERKLRIRPQ